MNQSFKLHCDAVYIGTRSFSELVPSFSNLKGTRINNTPTPQKEHSTRQPDRKWYHTHLLERTWKQAARQKVTSYPPPPHRDQNDWQTPMKTLPPVAVGKNPKMHRGSTIKVPRLKPPTITSQNNVELQVFCVLRDYFSSFSLMK